MARAKLEWIFGTPNPQVPQDMSKSVSVPALVAADLKKFGLENFSNNCYANSVIQALYFCTPFRDLMLQSNDSSITELVSPAPSSAPVQASQAANRRKPERKASTSIVPSPDTPVATTSTIISPIPSSPPSLFSALRSLFFHISTHPARSGTVSPRAFIEKLKEVNQVFNTTTHQDAHEFLNFLLNRIVEEVEEDRKVVVEDLSTSVTTLASHAPTIDSSSGHSSQDATLVHKLFEGVLTSETRCLTCETVSSRDESFLDLSIDIEHNSSVTACLRQFSASEMLCQRNKFFCDSCCDLQEAEKRMKIKRLPNVLALHLKRFKYQEDVQKYIKLAYRVAFPFELRLFNTVDDVDDADRLYNLFGIVVHIGNGPHHGHYVSIVKTHGTWLLFDDESVTPTAESEIPKYFGDSAAGAAYVLYYQAVDIDASKLGLSTEPTQSASVSQTQPAHPPGLDLQEGTSPILPPASVSLDTAILPTSMPVSIPIPPTDPEPVPMTPTSKVSGLFKTIRKSPSISAKAGFSGTLSNAPVLPSHTHLGLTTNVVIPPTPTVLTPPIVSVTTATDASLAGPLQDEREVEGHNLIMNDHLHGQPQSTPVMSGSGWSGVAPRTLAPIPSPGQMSTTMDSRVVERNTLINGEGNSGGTTADRSGEVRGEVERASVSANGKAEEKEKEQKHSRRWFGKRKSVKVAERTKALGLGLILTEPESAPRASGEEVFGNQLQAPASASSSNSSWLRTSLQQQRHPSEAEAATAPPPASRSSPSPIPREQYHRQQYSGPLSTHTPHRPLPTPPHSHLHPSGHTTQNANLDRQQDEKIGPSPSPASSFDSALLSNGSTPTQSSQYHSYSSSNSHVPNGHIVLPPAPRMHASLSAPMPAPISPSTNTKTSHSTPLPLHTSTIPSSIPIPTVLPSIRKPSLTPAKGSPERKKSLSSFASFRHKERDRGREKEKVWDSIPGHPKMNGNLLIDENGSGARLESGLRPLPSTSSVSHHKHPSDGRGLENVLVNETPFIDTSIPAERLDDERGATMGTGTVPFSSPAPVQFGSSLSEGTNYSTATSGLKRATRKLSLTAPMLGFGKREKEKEKEKEKDRTRAAPSAFVWA